MIGTVDSLKLMVQLLNNKEITGTEAEMWLTTLAFIQQPTIDMLAEVKVIPGNQTSFKNLYHTK